MKTIIGLALICIAFFFLTCGTGVKNTISVVTFNMYTGFDVEARVAELEGGADLSQVAQEILSDFQATTPTERMALAADELARLSPDFICLQEVTLFSASPLFYSDFLGLLLDDIKKSGGPDYEYIVAENITLNQSVDTGTVIPVSINYKDREAILYKKEFKIDGEAFVKKLSSHRDPFTYQGNEYVFYRDLLGARFKYGGEDIISLFSTHLDQAYLGDVQTGQMQEILDTIAPYAGDENLVLVGDFNSSEGEATYDLAPASGLVDTFKSLNPSDPGLTCCNLSDLSNPEPMPYQKIDLIFDHSALWSPKESRVILNKRGSIWPSDHFGVMTVFERVQPKK